MAVLMTPPYLQFFDNSTPGIPLNGGLIYTYAAGTSTPKATFTDYTEGVAATNPIVLDTQGRATVWVSGSYRFVIKDSLGNLIRDVDHVTSFNVADSAAAAYFQTFSGDGVTTVFTVSQNLGTDENALFIDVDAGAGKGYDPLNPNAYTINGTTLTFSVAPAVGVNNIFVRAPLTLLNAASAAAAAAATSETNAAASAVLAAQWATLTSGQVATTDYSAKAWSIGGTGVTTTSGKGAAKEWATSTGAAVDTSEYSAKEYAVGTTVAVGSAKDWATKTSAAVSTTFSAKEYAQGTQAATGGSAKNWAQQIGADVTGASANSRSSKSWSQDDLAGATLGGSAKDWAQSSSKPDGTLESSKTYAAQSAASAVTAATIAAGVLATSTTSLAIAVASKTFTTQAGKQFQAGNYVIASSAADPTNYMHGQITSYSGTTLIVDVQDIGGSGTKTDWNISISGTRGAIGATGATGSIPIAAAGGTADAITADYTPDLTLSDKVTCFVVAASANATTTPTFAPDGLTAHTIVKTGGHALVAGDIAAAGHVLLLEYNLANTRWELLNPAIPAILSVAQGGSGRASTTAYAVICGGTTSTSAEQSIASVGTSGQVLTSNGASALPTFQDAAGSSTLVLLGTATASSSSTLNFTSLIGAAYSRYMLVFNDLLLSTTGTVQLKLSSNNGSTYAEGLFGQFRQIQVGGVTITVSSIGSSPGAITHSIASPAISGMVDFTSTNNNTGFTWHSVLAGNDSNIDEAFIVSSSSSTYINAIQLLPSAGTFTSGKIYLYGVKNT